MGTDLGTRTGTVLVLGATGTVGGRLCRALAARGVAVRRATRRPAELAGEGEAVRFDLEEPDTFAAVLAGVAGVFLIARPGDDAPERLAPPFIAAMERAGVRHVVDLSAMGAERAPDFGLRRVERALEGSGLAWTHLRPNFFMEVFDAPPLGTAIRAHATIALPMGDARVSYVAAEDIAAVAAAALADPATHAGRAYTLTGPEALDGDAVAARLSVVTPRPVRYLALDEDAGRAALAAAGFSPARVERLVGFYRLVRAGAVAAVSDDVPQVLGRPAIPFARWVDEHAARFRSECQQC